MSLREILFKKHEGSRFLLDMAWGTVVTAGFVAMGLTFDTNIGSYIKNMSPYKQEIDVDGDGLLDIKFRNGAIYRQNVDGTYTRHKK